MLIPTRSLPLPLSMSYLLINRPIRLRHSLHGFCQSFALRVEPFLFPEQGGFLLFQCREVGRCGEMIHPEIDDAVPDDPLVCGNPCVLWLVFRMTGYSILCKIGDTSNYLAPISPPGFPARESVWLLSFLPLPATQSPFSRRTSTPAAAGCSPGSYAIQKPLARRNRGRCPPR